MHLCNETYFQKQSYKKVPIIIDNQTEIHTVHVPKKTKVELRKTLSSGLLSKCKDT